MKESSDFAAKCERIADVEFLKFDRVANKRSLCSDLHAFMLLAERFPSKGRFLSYASHDEIVLGVKWKDVRTLSAEEIVELTRCGVRFDCFEECLKMFV